MNVQLRIALALLLAGHGVAHLPGFLVAWRLREFPGLPYATTVLAGRLDVGPVGIRVIGGLWLIVGLAAATVGSTMLVRGLRVPSIVWPVLVASVILCAFGWPAARLGLVANMLIAAMLLVVAIASSAPDLAP